MIGYFIIASYALFCLFANKIRVLQSFILLFPLHASAKQLLTVMGIGGAFSIWYDLAIFAIFIKAFWDKHFRFKNFRFSVGFFVLVFIYFCYSYFLLSPPDAESVSTFRLFTHCILLFTSLSIIRFRYEELRALYSSIIFSTFLYCISALVIYFVFQEEWHFLMDHYDLTMTLRSPSFQMMGFDRLYGFLPGPNQFGVYIAFIIVFLLFVKKTVKVGIVYKLCLALSALCLFLSLSRAGWAIVFISMSLTTILDGKAKKLFGFAIKTVGAIVIFVSILAMSFRDHFLLVLATFNGEDSSAAGRADNVFDGIMDILQTPWGFGLGTGINETGAPVAESGLVILFYEFGIIGAIIFYYFIIAIGLQILRSKTKYSKTCFSLIIASIITSIVSMNVFQYPYIYYLFGIMGIAKNPYFCFYLRQYVNIKKRKRVITKQYKYEHNQIKHNNCDI